MTDNEIVKALECCGEDSGCPECCPLKDIAYVGDCVQFKSKSALDLINRLQAENENYSKNNQQMTSDILKLYKELEQAKAENERLKNHIKEGINLAKQLPEMVSLAKAEAYKEFAERLKEKAEKVEIDRDGDFVEADFEIYDTVANWCKATSDNLLKEMEGEK